MAVAVQLRVPLSSSKTTAFVYIFEYKFDFDDAHVSNSVILFAAPVLLRSDYFLDFELDPDCESPTVSFGVATLLDSTFAVELGFTYDFRSGWVLVSNSVGLLAAPGLLRSPTASSIRARP